MHREDILTHIPIADSLATQILMHRDVHFGKNFSIMIEYYEKNGVGCLPEISVEEIKKVQAVEEKAEKLLPQEAIEAINRNLKFYEDLRTLYESREKACVQIAIADLILSEEEDPKQEMGVLLKLQQKAVDPLIDLVLSAHFYDPLSPGYGRAPMFAAKILAKIQDDKAIPALFSALGQDNFFTDDAIINALQAFGDSAKQFLLDQLLKRPFSKDNEHAAIVLSSMDEDEDIAHTALTMLADPEPVNFPSLFSYLIFCCSGLKDPEERKRFEDLCNTLPISAHLQNEMKIVIKHWK